MGIRHLPAQSRQARLWRNGGGDTRDVVVYPSGSSDDDFMWRASIATITDAGPFSAWPGVDRTLLVLRGRLGLALGWQGEIQLDENASALEFAGEDAVVVSSLSAPCQVLNFMSRRGRARIRLMRGITTITIEAGQVLLLAGRPTAIKVDDKLIPLDEMDALLLEFESRSLLQINEKITIAMIEVM